MSSLRVTPELEIDDDWLSWHAVRAGGPGGQNVNKVATAVQLRFEAASCPSLTPAVRVRLAQLAGRRMTNTGILIISAQRFRTRERNLEDARERLTELLRRALIPPRPRRPTRPTRAAKERRLTEKKLRGDTKRLRRNARESD